jgi:hypothetical protein
MDSDKFVENVDELMVNKVSRRVKELLKHKQVFSKQQKRNEYASKIKHFLSA